MLHKSLTTTRSGLCIKKQSVAAISAQITNNHPVRCVYKEATPSQHLFTVNTTLLIVMLISSINQYHRVAQLLEAMRYEPEGRGFGTRWCHWNFFLTYDCDPGVDSASNRNEYQEYFLGVKATGAYGWQLYHLLALIVLKFGSLNLLAPSWPVQACNGIALRFCHLPSQNLEP